MCALLRWWRGTNDDFDFRTANTANCTPPAQLRALYLTLQVDSCQRGESTPGIRNQAFDWSRETESVALHTLSKEDVIGHGADTSISSASCTTADDVSALPVDTLFLESSVSMTQNKLHPHLAMERFFERISKLYGFLRTAVTHPTSCPYSTRISSFSSSRDC